MMMTMKLKLVITLALVMAATVVAGPVTGQTAGAITWQAALRQPAEWYGSAEAIRIADNLLSYQRDVGGWPKNIDMAANLDGPKRAEILKAKKDLDATIDNSATYTQLIFLARVYDRTKIERYRDSFLVGVDYLLEAQYRNGGWPQFYPLQEGYYTHITYNDDAMVGVMKLLDEIGQKHTPYQFVDEHRRARARKAVQSGIECILKTQVVVAGRRTVWCAQHDEVTLAPAPARTYEHISLSGQESVGIIRFLMSVEHPDVRIIDAVESAVAWFKSAQINGIRLVVKQDATKLHGFDRVVVNDAGAPPLWARFYEIGTNRPIFSGRDSLIKYSVAEIEDERRNGYRWYTEEPATMINQDYPQWRRRIAPAKAALK